MKKIILLICFLCLTSCADLRTRMKGAFEPKSDLDGVQESHRPLEQQRLLARKGYEGHLTNRVCTKFYGSKCETESIRKYDIKDPSIRKRLIEFRFACKIGGKRYRVCKDQEGFCRKELHKDCKKWGKTLFTRKKVCRKWVDRIEKDFIPVDDYQYLLDGATECKQGL